MKKILISLSLLSAVAFVSSCKKKKNPEPDNDKLTVADFKKTINENPNNNQILGTIDASGPGTLTYTLVTGLTASKVVDATKPLVKEVVVPASSFTINSSTGELKVANRKKFDYETAPNYQVTAKVKVSNGDDEVTGNITIILNDINEDHIIKGH